MSHVIACEIEYTKRVQYIQSLKGGTTKHQFLFYLFSMLPTKFQVNCPFSSGEEAKKIDFKDGGQGGLFGFPIETILAIFDVQVTPMLPTKFQVNWPLGSGEKSKKQISR